MLKAPIITGKTPPNAEREVIYQDFREAKERVIVVSKVANFAIDLPDASVAIQVSGTFGSRQEEAQRLGRILRPERTKLLVLFGRFQLHNRRNLLGKQAEVSDRTGL